MLENIKEYLPTLEAITLVKKFSKADKKKLRVIKKLLLRKYNGTVAAAKLNLTSRQVRNLKREVIAAGDAGVIHKNHYHQPLNTYAPEIRKTLAKIYRKSYRGVNFTKFAAIMRAEYGYTQSRSTIYNILRQQKIRSPERKRKKRHAKKAEKGN